MSRPNLTVENLDGDEIVLPAIWEVCGACAGTGSTSSHLGHFTPGELHDHGEQFVEDYFAGRYDRPCGTCDGRRVVAALDEDRATPEQAALWWGHVQNEAEDRAVRAAEMRAGA